MIPFDRKVCQWRIIICGTFPCGSQPGIAAAVPMSAKAQSTDVDFWFEQMLARKNASYEGVQDYTKKTNSMGMSTFEYYEKTSALELDNGDKVYIMRSVPPSEIEERHAAANEISGMSAAELERAADAIELAGMNMEQGMMAEMSASQLPGGIGTMLMNPPPGKALVVGKPEWT